MLIAGVGPGRCPIACHMFSSVLSGVFAFFIFAILSLALCVFAPKPAALGGFVLLIIVILVLVLSPIDDGVASNKVYDEGAPMRIGITVFSWIFSLAMLGGVIAMFCTPKVQASRVR